MSLGLFINSKSIATSSNNLLTQPHANSESTNYSLLDLQNTNSHVCDFEIPLKGLATQTLQFVTPKLTLKV